MDQILLLSKTLFTFDLHEIFRPLDQLVFLAIPDIVAFADITVSAARAFQTFSLPRMIHHGNFLYLLPS